MKLKRDDTVMVMVGKDKGKTGKITAVIPTKNQVVVENLNTYKRHTKPSDKNPRGGIIEHTRPLDASKVMIVDPESGLPARIGYTVNADGTKERVFKVGAQRLANKSAKKAVAKKTDDDKKTEDKPAAKKAPAKAKTEGGAK